MCSNVHCWLGFSGVQFSNSTFRTVIWAADIEVNVAHWEFHVSFCDVRPFIEIVFADLNGSGCYTLMGFT